MKPSRLLLTLLAGLLLLSIGLGSLTALEIHHPQQLHLLWWGLLLALLLSAGLDAWWLRRLPSPTLERQLPGNLPLGRWSEVRLTLHHSFRQALDVELFDHVPDGMQCEALPQRIQLRPGEHTQSQYRLRPTRRGHFELPCCELLLPSPLGLWWSRRTLASQDQTRVYPDFARLYGAQLKAVDDWLSQLGVRQRPRRGLGLEFHQLREFRDGDTLRQIDWKATARKRTPIAREYQDERDQQIIFLLDCGRRMRSQDGDLSHFDHALNACLLLAYVALRQGDAVGLATFAGQQARFVPPGKGQAQLGHLLNGVYDLETTLQPADYAEALQQLMARQKRRALVVLVSNLRDEDDDALLASAKRLARSHRLLIASLREEVLDRLRHQPVQQLDDAMGYCGTLDYLQARDALHERLQAHNLPVLDCRPGELGPQLVSQYLAWKKAGVL